MSARRSRREIVSALASVPMIGAGTYAQAAHTITMGHVVLLGDSVFDNAAYVSGGPDVVTQLRKRLPQGWRASLNAVDGSVVANLPQQLERMPPDATHLVISAGGNDALGYSSILTAASRSMAESIGRLAEIRDDFQNRYSAALAAVANAACRLLSAPFMTRAIPIRCSGGSPRRRSRSSTMSFSAKLSAWACRSSICA